MQFASILVLFKSVLGVLAALLVVAVLAGVRVPYIGSDRAALIALLVVGVAMCGLGIRPETYSMLNPFSLAGVVIGTVAAAGAAAYLLGARVPFIATDQAALLALAGVMAVKTVLGVARGLLS